MKGKAVPVGDATACTWVFDMLLGERLTACGDRDALPPLEDLNHRADALASDQLVSAQGKRWVAVALRKDAGLVVTGDGNERRFGRVGAQLAIADLDQDGDPEVATTVDTLAPRHDALEVRSVRAGSLERRYRIAVPTGIEALAACPPEDDGRARLLLASAGRLWVIE
jgi:hypothetical protein